LVAEAKGRMFRRKDGNYFLYLPRKLVEDSAFPFNLESSVPVHVAIDDSRQKLLVMPIRPARVSTIHRGRESRSTKRDHEETTQA